MPNKLIAQYDLAPGGAQNTDYLLIHRGAAEDGTGGAYYRMARSILLAGVGGGLVDDAVSNTILANMAANTVKANILSSAADPQDVSLGTFKTWLALVKADVGLGNVQNVDAVPRANHTGTQAQSTVVGLESDLAARLLKGGDTMTGALTLAADPVNAMHAATRQWVLALLTGFRNRTTVRLASVGNVNLAAPGTTMDGVTFASGNVFMAKNQTDPAQNGIYNWNGAGTPATRNEQFDTWDEHPGTTVAVKEGTVNADTIWLCASNDGGTLGSTAINWASFSAAGALQAVNNLGDLPSAPAARINLGLAIGTNVQAYSADLAAIAGLGVTNDSIIQGKSGAWAKRTMQQLLADLVLSGLSTASAAAIANTDNVQQALGKAQAQLNVKATLYAQMAITLTGGSGTLDCSTLQPDGGTHANRTTYSVGNGDGTITISGGNNDDVIQHQLQGTGTKTFSGATAGAGYTNVVPSGGWYTAVRVGGVWYSLTPSPVADTGDIEDRLDAAEAAIAGLEEGGAPAVVTGDSEIGSTLTVAFQAGWTMARQWQRSTNGGASFSNISAQTGATYDTTGETDGYQIRCFVGDATSGYYTNAITLEDPPIVAPYRTLDNFRTDSAGTTYNYTKGSGSFVSGDIVYALFMSRPQTSGQFVTGVSAGGGAAGTEINVTGAGLASCLKVFRCIAGSGADLTFTSPGGTTNKISGTVYCFNPAVAGAADRTAQNSENGVTTFASPPTTAALQQAHEFVMAIVCDRSNSGATTLTGPNTGYTLAKSDTDVATRCVIGHKEVNATTAVSANATASGNCNMEAIVATVRLL